MRRRVEASHEYRRGCGYRKPGLYLEGKGAPDGRLPLIVLLAIPVDQEDDPPFRSYRYVDGDALLGIPTGGDQIGEERAEDIREMAEEYAQRMRDLIPPGDAWNADVNWLLWRLTPEHTEAALKQVWGRVAWRVESELRERG